MPANLTWTTEPPSQEGTYVLFDHTGGGTPFFRLRKIKAGEVYEMYGTMQRYGPIPEPSEAQEATE